MNVRRRVHPSRLIRGDHVFVRRHGLLYSHHGIFDGDGVIHYSDAGGLAAKDRCTVAKTPLDDFLRGGVLRRVEYATRSSRDVTVRRARLLLNRGLYSVLFNNCEHFASYCATGRRRSLQVRRFAAATAAVATVVSAGGAILIRRRFRFRT